MEERYETREEVLALADPDPEFADVCYAKSLL
jgi:hypothetical protein